MEDEAKTRFERVRELYPVAFPEELLGLWRVASGRRPSDPRAAFGEDAVGLRLTGPFDLMAVGVDRKKAKCSFAVHQRFPLDPPEFFTVAESTADGLHWGYWFDRPSGPPVVAAYDTEDEALRVAVEGGSLVQALVRHLEGLAERLEEDRQYDPDGADYYNEGLGQVASARELLLGFARSDGHDLTSLPVRDIVAPTTDGMGVVGGRESYVELMPVVELARSAARGDLASVLDRAEAALRDGFPSTALQVGKAAWATAGAQASHERAVDLMARAYEGVGHSGLAEVIREHAASRGSGVVRAI